MIDGPLDRLFLGESPACQFKVYGPIRGLFSILSPQTTSHPGAIEVKREWYLIYHTADAKGGGHFRRSVAIDIMRWDDSVSPARILKVKQTHEPSQPAPPTRNIAPAAHATASNEPVPVQYWIKALNDGIARPNPLPPDMWASWTPHNPPSQWIQYEWAKPVTLEGSRILFWSDHRQGANVGVAPPAASNTSVETNGFQLRTQVAIRPRLGSFVDVKFDPEPRAAFNASGDGQQYAAIAVEEWEALAPALVAPSALKELTPESGAGPLCPPN